MIWANNLFCELLAAEIMKTSLNACSHNNYNDNYASVYNVLLSFVACCFKCSRKQDEFWLAVNVFSIHQLEKKKKHSESDLSFCAI